MNVKCRICRQELKKPETAVERFNRIVESLKRLFPQDAHLCKQYAVNYIGQSKIFTYPCRLCGEVTATKPHQYHWYFLEDLQWQKK